MSHATSVRQYLELTGQYYTDGYLVIQSCTPVQ